MSRMFSVITKTWNPVTGCYYCCYYCWARKLAKRLRKINKKYKDGFEPHIHLNEFNKKFGSGEFIFVTSMGDLFGCWVPNEWIEKVINYVKKFPETEFLFLTKNPQRYLEFQFPDNVWLGATIETDRDDIYKKYRISLAPLPKKRLEVMKRLQWDKKFISIEPILIFSHKFAERIREIHPQVVYIGYDNYNNGLPEPPLQKTQMLINNLRSFTTVYIKTLR